jgi:hypothetical protein
MNLPYRERTKCLVYRHVGRFTRLSGKVAVDGNTYLKAVETLAYTRSFNPSIISSCLVALSAFLVYQCAHQGDQGSPIPWV